MPPRRSSNWHCPARWATSASPGRSGWPATARSAIDAKGKINIAAASLVTDRVDAEGDATIDLQARGTVAAPELTGQVVLTDANLVADEISVAAERINARLDLAGSRVRLETLSADVNGGTLKGAGEASLGAGGIRDINLELTTSDFAYDAPLDLRTLSNGTVRIQSKGEEIVVDGRITVDEGGLTGDINFDTGLLAAVTERRKLDLTEERNPLLDRVRFNVAVDTATPILVDNNLAQAEIDVNVRLLGTPYETGLSGQIEVREGGEIRLNERSYETERGIIRFLDERRIVPTFDLLLNTTANNYDVTIAVSGTTDDTETTLTSEPSLPEPDIMALLVTGRTLDEMRGEEFDVAREQMLSYLAGRVGSSLGRGLEKATGLSEVRVEPHLIGNEADPSARLTVGQELTDNLELIYSTDLVDSNDQIWVAEYDVTRRFQTRAVRQSDASYRVDFSHDVGLGGTKPPRRQPRERPDVGMVTVVASGAMPEAELRELLQDRRRRRVRLLQRAPRRRPHRRTADRTRLSPVARAARTRRHGERRQPDAARGRRANRRRGVRRRDAARQAPRRGRSAVAPRRLRPSARGRCDRGGAQLAGRRQSTRSDDRAERRRCRRRRAGASCFACSRGLASTASCWPSKAPSSCRRGCSTS